MNTEKECRHVAFVHANVITMKNSSVLTDQTVLIKDGKIDYIGNDSDFKKESFDVIDCSGKYLIPGLIDMHVHLGDNEDDLLLYLANGVTTIRNMWGYEKFRLLNWLFGTRVFNHLLLRYKINRGEITGPTIYTAGPMNEGEHPFFPAFMVTVLKSVKEAEAMVLSHKNKGYDFIKFYSTIPEHIFNAIVHTAREYNIPIAGHVPDTVGIEKVIQAKVASVEHLLGFFNPYNPDMALKESEIARIADLSARNEVFHCPTLIASERICNVENRQKYEAEEEMAYLPQRIKKGMRFLQDASYSLMKKKGLKPNHEYMPYLFRVIQELKKHGAKIISGSDKATPYVTAGFSIHRELHLLCKAGLSPFEALQTGTIHAALCLKKADDIGTIEVGKKADLLLVNKNPLVDIDTLKTHCGVMHNGKWISRDACNRILDEIKNRN